MSLESRSPLTGASVRSSGLGRAQEILLDTARQLGGSLDPDAIFTRMLNSVRGAMRCDGMIVSSFDATTCTIRCAYAWVGGNVLDPATLPPLTWRPDSAGMQSQVIRTGRPMIFDDVGEHTPLESVIACAAAASARCRSFNSRYKIPSKCRAWANL